MAEALTLPALAQTSVDPARVDELVDVVALNECRITEPASAIFFPAAGFEDREEIRAIVGILLATGRARLEATGDSGALMTYGGPCPELGDEQNARHLLLSTLADSGCDLSVDEARPLLEAEGLEMQEVRMMMPILVEENVVSMSDDEMHVTLSERSCKYYSPKSYNGLDPEADPGGALIAYLESNDCRLSFEDAKTELPAIGLSMDDAERVAQEFIADGSITVGENETLILNTGSCS